VGQAGGNIGPEGFRRQATARYRRNHTVFYASGQHIRPLRHRLIRRTNSCCGRFDASAQEFNGIGFVHNTI